jgi:dihydroorotase-like cyclic amidohydrolase
LYFNSNLPSFVPPERATREVKYNRNALRIVSGIPVFREPVKASGRMDLGAWDDQSPGFLETENVFRVAFFGEKTGCPVNIVHMSAVESLDLARRMRHPNRAAINVETCIHYLSLTRDSAIGDLGKVISTEN